MARQHPWKMPDLGFGGNTGSRMVWSGSVTSMIDRETMPKVPPTRARMSQKREKKRVGSNRTQIHWRAGRQINTLWMPNVTTMVERMSKKEKED